MTGEGSGERPPISHQMRSCTDAEERREEPTPAIVSPYLRSPYRAQSAPVETSVPGVKAGEHIEVAQEAEEEGVKEPSAGLRLLLGVLSVVKLVVILGLVIGAGVLVVRLAIQRSTEQERAQPKVFFTLGCRAFYGCGREVGQSCGLAYEPLCIEVENKGDGLMPSSQFRDLTFYLTADEPLTFEPHRMRMLDRDGACVTLDTCDVSCSSLRNGQVAKFIMPIDSDDVFNKFSHVTISLSGDYTEFVKECARNPIG